MLKIRPVDMPFNIMGMPAFLGYYVTHSWDSNKPGYMSFAPHWDSQKPPLEPGTLPEKKLGLVYATRNVKNGDLYANIIALNIVGLSCCYWAIKSLY